MKIRGIEDLEEIREKGLESLFPDKLRLRVGMASCGLGAGGRAVFDALDRAREGKDILLSETGCIGSCYVEPLVELYIPNHEKVLFKNMDEESAYELVEAVAEGEIPEKYAFCRMEKEDFLVEGETRNLGELSTSASTSFEGKVSNKIPPLRELDFFKCQRKIALRNAGYVNPEDIREYIAKGGYFSLHEALQMDRDSIIEEISKSGLRGRGGAGFPTGRKWRLTKEAEGDRKYVVVNGDEGDPGAYMDRALLESDPHSILEGAIISAYAIGADRGFIFVRNEYPKAVERAEEAVRQAEKYGLLGKNVMGSDFELELRVHKGGGAFVSGEETAMISSIEGGRPSPRPRPPYPSESGLWGEPTCINNVETLANVPPIIARGGEFLGEMGTKKSGGTKVFSLVGSVERRGLIEIEIGETFEEIVFDAGNADKSKTKAIQIGGPSGGFLPVKYSDIPLDFETVAEIGSIMGSGGLVVMDGSTCLVDMAKYFLDFTLGESCGHCTPGREGLERMHEILDKITRGEAKEGDLELLRELSQYVEDASLCGLGKTAPRPILTSLDHFGGEYKEHIVEGKCRANVCDLGEKSE